MNYSNYVCCKTTTKRIERFSINVLHIFGRFFLPVKCDNMKWVINKIYGTFQIFWNKLYSMVHSMKYSFDVIIKYFNQPLKKQHWTPNYFVVHKCISLLYSKNYVWNHQYSSKKLSGRFQNTVEVGTLPPHRIVAEIYTVCAHSERSEAKHQK